MARIDTAVVVGAGSMGSGIAAHLANSGGKVWLLDLPDEGEDRARRARSGIERQVKQCGFYLPEFAERVTPGTVDDDLHRVAEADWIVEAVVENPEIKRDIYARIEEHRAPGTPVSSNTSSIPLATLTEGASEQFRRDFLITHFFNPPRTMRLIEIVAGEETDSEIVDRLVDVAERQLGKVAIRCRDTPGFIANRIGNLWLAAGAVLAFEQGIDPATADRVFGKPFGVPRTGIFGLLDFVGLQLVPSLWGSLIAAMPQGDAYHRYKLADTDELAELLEKGYTGRTGESGFYRGRGEVYDFSAHDYVEAKPAEDEALAKRTAAEVLDTDTPAGRYARDVFRATLGYCLDVAAEIADTVEPIDAAMRLGYGWKRGPFELADSIGLDKVVALFDEPHPLLSAAADRGGFYPDADTVLGTGGEAQPRARREGVVTAAALIEDAERIIATDGTEVYRLPDGVGLATLTTPMNSCSPAVLDAFAQAAERDDLTALVIGNDEERAFSAGADLKTLATLAKAGDPDEVAGFMRQGIDTLNALRAAPFPVVAAARGNALGGGLELLLASDAAVVHTETRLSFPEPTLGLLPGWNGTVRLLKNLVAAGVDEPHQRAFRAIMTSKRFRGAHEALEAGVLDREVTRVEISLDHVLAAALDLARELADGYEPAPEPALPAYPADAEPLSYTDGSETDRLIGEALARVYTARDGEETTSFGELARRETEETARIITQPANAARAEHMAAHRRPLKN